jgi:hypothetical protein
MENLNFDLTNNNSPKPSPETELAAVSLARVFDGVVVGIINKNERCKNCIKTPCGYHPDGVGYCWFHQPDNQ